MPISISVTITVTDPESHPHDTSSDFHTHALDVSHSEQILFTAISMYHVNHTINRSWKEAFSLVEGEIPSLAACMAVGDAKNTIPEDAKASFVRRFVKDTFLKKQLKPKFRTEFEQPMQLSLAIILVDFR